MFKKLFIVAALITGVAFAQVSTTGNRVSYSGNGSTTAFSYPNKFFSNSDLVVIDRTTATGAEVVKTLTTHYTVTGAGASAGGTVTMLTAPASGHSLIIYQDPARTQTLDLDENDALPPEQIEQRFDKLVIQNQRDAARFDRTLRLTEGHPTFDMELPDLLTAGDALVVNDTADGWSLVAIGDLNANAQAPAGGTTGQILTKTSGTDYDYDWQTPATAGITDLTGDVTASGSGSVAATIADDAVTNAKSANMAQSTIKGRAVSAGTGDPTDLTAAQATAILDNMVGDSGAGGTKGLVPAPASGDAAANKYLKADGTWTTVASGGGTWGSITGTLSDQTDLQSALDGKQATDSDLTAVAGLASNGLIARTGAGTASARTVTGTANQITVTNGDGVSGNPTLSIPSNPTFPGTKTTVNGIDYITGTDDPTVTATSAAAGSQYTNTSTGNIYRKTDAGSSTNWVLFGTSAAITAPVAYTPTITGCGTVSSVNFYYRQIGDYLHIEGSFVSGTPAATGTTFTLPNSGTIGTINSDTLVGSGTRNNASGGVFSVIATASGASTLGIGNKSGANGLSVVNCNSIIASGDVVAVNAVVRVAGLSSVVNTATTPVITAPTSYTPTFTGWGTVTTSNFKYWQIGSSVYVEGRFQVATSTATEARISFPSVCSSASSDYVTLQKVGWGATSVTGRSLAILTEPSVAYFTFGDSSGAGLAKANGSSLASSGENISFTATVRCTGMPGVIPAPNLVGFATNNGSSAIRMEMAAVASQSGGSCAVTELGGSDWISGNATSGTAGDCTYTFNAGIFSSAPVCVCSQVGSNSKICSINTTPTTSGFQTYTVTDGGAASNSAVSIYCAGPR